MQVERIRYGSNFFELVVLFLCHSVLHRFPFDSVQLRRKDRKKERERDLGNTKQNWNERAREQNSAFCKRISRRISCLSILLQHFQMIANNFISIFFFIRSVYCVFCSYVTVFIPSYFILLDLPINKYQVTFANANIFSRHFFFVYFVSSIFFFFCVILSCSVRYCVVFLTFQGRSAAVSEIE